MARLGTDRLRLARVPGLVFWRLLGTGRGSDTGPGVDPRRTALFAVWDDDAALDAFLATSAIGRRWSTDPRRGVARPAPVRSADTAPGGASTHWTGSCPAPRRGRSPIVTRADVRPSVWRTFGRAGRVVDDELHRADGLIDVVGIGEAPVGRLATFSLWESIEAARRFAYSMPDHVEVVRRTRAEHWYSEELFARFEPYGSSGRWNGRDPLHRP